MPLSPLPLMLGTLDLLVLRTLASGAMHGYGIATLVHERPRSLWYIQVGYGGGSEPPRDAGSRKRTARSWISWNETLQLVHPVLDHHQLR